MKKNKKTKDVDERTEKQKFLDDKAEVAYIRKHGINGKYDPSFDNLKQHKNAVKGGVGTLQGMAENFRDTAKTIKKLATSFTEYPPGYKIKGFTVEGWWVFYSDKIDRLRQKKYFDIDLPEAPKLPANDYRKELRHIALWFDNSAAILDGKKAETQTTDKEATTPQRQGAIPSRRTEIRQKAERYVKEHGYPGIKPLSKKIRCAPKTLREAIKASVLLKAEKYQFDAKRPKAVTLTPVIIKTGGKKGRRGRKDSSVEKKVYRKELIAKIKAIVEKQSKKFPPQIHAAASYVKGIDIHKYPTEQLERVHEALKENQDEFVRKNKTIVPKKL